jgi:catechol 2,3-dioxygenase-like lactoylglutathione lyase family enzyme
MPVLPLLTVRDVEASSRFYQNLLGCKSGHGGKEYEVLVQNGQPLLQLHRWEAHEHPGMGDPDAAPHGYGVALFFQIDAFDAAVERARGLGTKIVDGPKVNPNAKHRELWIHDPDGYTVVLNSKRGDLG